MLSFLMPVFIWMAVCAFHGIYPFGAKSVMTGDITYQFIDYLAYFKSVILSGNDLSYTFSKTIGGDMAGFSSYYLYSPFNLILIFFPNRLLPLALLAIIIIKCGCMSLFFEYMITAIYGFKKRSLVFSVTYSLMGYAVVYFQLYAYFDDMMLLPLIVLGIHRLIEDPKKRLSYIIPLTLALILNFYVGWMICLFSALYFLYRALAGKRGADRYVSFAVSSLISGLMSAFVVLPALLSLRGEKDSFHLGFYRTMDMADFFTRFYTDSFKGNISSCMPNVYCGVTVLVLAVFFFLNKEIEKRERLLSLAFVLFLTVNFYINTLNVIWHGLNRPIGFPYRYSFLLTFLLILLAYRQSLTMDKSGVVKKLGVMLLVYLGYSAFVLVRGSEVIGKREIILDGGVLLALLVVFALWSAGKLRAGIFVLAIMLIQLADIGENMRSAFYYFEFADMAEYQRYVDRVGEVIDEIRKEDDSFYRIEKTFKRTHNDSMQFDYAGMTHYSSCEKKDVISYMKKLGFRDNGNWSFYDSGSTSLVDSIFGIKYLISHYDYTGKKYRRFYDKRYEDEKFFVYRNQYALPLMFVAKRDITSMDTGDDNTFEFQNKLADAVTGGENHLYTPVDIEECNLMNLTETVGDDGVHTFTKTDPGQEAYIEYVTTATNQTYDKLMMGYFDAPDYQKARIECNGDDKGEYFSEYHWSVVDFAKHDAGDKVSVRIVPEEDSIRLSAVYLYYEDSAGLKAWFDEVSMAECSLEKITSSHLKGNAWLPEDGQIVFSFPYEEDWEVFVDGRKVVTDKAAGLLLSTSVSAGVHSVELKYHQAGRPAGLLISVFGLAVLLCFTIPKRSGGKE